MPVSMPPRECSTWGRGSAALPSVPFCGWALGPLSCTGLGPEAHVVCVETATAMRERGAARVTDPRVTWLAALPRRGPFDCILSGAAIWLMLPLEDTLARWRALLAPGGCLAFDIPAAYLGQTDDPGGGNDPHLLGLVQALAEKALGLPAEPAASLPSPEAISVLLEGLGFTVTRWTHSARLTQAAYRDWLKLPAVNGSLLGRVPVAERAALVDAAWEGVDQTAWRPERWLGWTAVLP